MTRDDFMPTAMRNIHDHPDKWEIYIELAEGGDWSVSGSEFAATVPPGCYVLARPRPMNS